MRYNLRSLDKYIRSLSSKRFVEISSDLGYSVEGFPVYAVKIGKGERALVSFARIHGDEASSTAGILNTIRVLLKEPSVAENVGYVGVPCLNPDGAKRNQRRNSNGVDVNRDFGIYEEGTNFHSKEAIAARNIMERFLPSYVLDHHNSDFNRIDFNCFGNPNDDGLQEPVEERINKKISEIGYVNQNDIPFLHGDARRCGQLVNFAADNFCSATIIEARGKRPNKNAVLMHTIADLEVLKCLAEAGQP